MSKSEKDRTEAEIRDWYARAEAGTLSSPMTPEEKAGLLSFMNEIEADNAYPVVAKKIEKEVALRKDATFTMDENYSRAKDPKGK